MLYTAQTFLPFNFIYFGTNVEYLADVPDVCPVKRGCPRRHVLGLPGPCVGDEDLHLLDVGSAASGDVERLRSLCKELLLVIKKTHLRKRHLDRFPLS